MWISDGRRRCVGWIAALLAAIGAGAWYLHARFSDDEPGVHVHPGLRTTWLDGPLRSDGTVDYVEFVRAERSRGVTLANDLAPILSLCLERPLRGVPPAADRERPPFPVVSWWSWAADHGVDKKDTSAETGESSLEDPVEVAERVWLNERSDGSHSAEIRRWLAEIGPALDVLQREARVRGAWFQPPEFRDLCCFGLVGSLRAIVPCFVMRAFGRSADGDHAGAVEDIETVFGLIGRWRGCDGLLGFFAVLACEGYAAESLASVAERDAAWRCADFRRVDAAMPHASRDEQLSEMLPWERLSMLDDVVEATLDPTLLERSMRAWNQLEETMRDVASGTSDGGKPSPPPIDLQGDGRHDAAVPARAMDRLLELLNEDFDARARLLLEKDWEARIEALRAKQKERGGAQRRFTFHWDFWRDRTLTEEVACHPKAVAALIADLADPSWRGALETTVTTTVASDAARMRLALACFRNEHGRLPRDAAELAAACFDAPPRDRLFRELLGWTVREDGSIEITARGAPLAARLKADRNTWWR